MPEKTCFADALSGAQSATGRYNGYWKTDVPERFADCTGYLDPITKRGHVVNYVGGDLRGSGCGAIIATTACK